MIYVDLSCDRISGQQLMQRALKERVIKEGWFSEKSQAKVFVYSQIPLDFDAKEWEEAKKRGVRIVFIHHYFENFERYAIFMNERAFNLVDMHIVHGTDCSLFTYLKSKGKKMLLFDLAGVNREYIKQNYFLFDDEKKNSICYVGRFSKGIDNFLKFIENSKLDSFEKNIYCSLTKDKEYLLEDKRLEKCNVIVNKTGDELYEMMSKNRFIYINYDMHAIANHIELTMQEAMSMGVINVIGNNQKSYLYMPNIITGFIDEKEFESYINKDLFIHQFKQYEFLRANYQTLDKILEKIILNLIFICQE